MASAQAALKETLSSGTALPDMIALDLETDVSPSTPACLGHPCTDLCGFHLPATAHSSCRQVLGVVRLAACPSTPANGTPGV